MQRRWAAGVAALVCSLTSCATPTASPEVGTQQTTGTVPVPRTPTTASCAQGWSLVEMVTHTVPPTASGAAAEGRSRPELWSSGPSTPPTTEWSELAAAAALNAASVWCAAGVTRSHVKPVIVLVVSAEEFARAANASPSDPTVAMVLKRGGKDSLWINAALASRLTPEGRLAVVTHEFSHVIERSVTTAGAPTWLSEGVADYVAYTTTSLPIPAIAPGLRGAAPPPVPPSTPEFDRTASPVAYQRAWAACVALARAGKDPHAPLTALRRYAHGATVPDPAGSQAFRHEYAAVLSELNRGEDPRRVLR